MERVGVRELRQNLSVYLRRVGRGETLEVTDRGHPVALLAPLPTAAGAVALLTMQGRVARAARSPVASMPPAVEREPGEPSLQDLLAADRAERL